MNAIQSKAGAMASNAPATVTPNAQAGSGFALNNQKDAKDAATATQFGDVWKDMQAKYGAKAEKPREIKKQLGKDDFLRIMVTQMKHQDPTSPFKAEQFAAELAQFTSVEQLQNINSNLNKMGTQNQPLERLAMTNLIGKTVTIDRDRFPHTEGMNASLHYNLPKDAKSVKVMVVNDAGEVLYEKEMGSQKSGDNLAVWDGLKSGTTLPAKSGTYNLKVEAKDDRDQTIPISSRGSARIIGVSFEGAEPLFLVGDPSKPDKITMRNVVKIDEGGMLGAPAPVVPGAQQLSDAAAKLQTQSPQSEAGQGQVQSQGQGQPGSGNFFSFEKGKGSSNLDPSQVSQQAQAAIAQFMSGKQGSQQGPSTQTAVSGAASSPTAKASVPNSVVQGEERGFPNGLSSDRDEVAATQASAKAANTASGARSENGHNKNKE